MYVVGSPFDFIVKSISTSQFIVFVLFSATHSFYFITFNHNSGKISFLLPWNCRLWRSIVE